MSNKGVQNAQLQGPQSSTAGQEAATCWWAVYAEGGDGKNGIARF